MRGAKGEAKVLRAVDDVTLMSHRYHVGWWANQVPVSRLWRT